jgi:hypothetical protein
MAGNYGEITPNPSNDLCPTPTEPKTGNPLTFTSTITPLHQPEAISIWFVFWLESLGCGREFLYSYLEKHRQMNHDTLQDLVRSIDGFIERIQGFAFNFTSGSERG